MDLADEFARQLSASLAGFLWAVEQIAPERQRRAPPDSTRLGQWSPARHVFHLLTYEREVALPSMRCWLGAPQPDDARFLREDELWATEGEPQSTEQLIAQLRAVRDAQVALLAHFAPTDWQAQRQPIPFWGPVTLRWMLTKTLQHTAEHTNDVLRLVLYWDRALQRANPSVASEPLAAPRAHTPE